MRGNGLALSIGLWIWLSWVPFGAWAESTAPSPTLIVLAERIWTGDPDRPWASALAVEGDRLVAVGDRSSVLSLAGDQTRRLDLGKRFVVPGLIDNHTHFDDAGALLLGVNLLAVSDENALIEEVTVARDRLPAGSWIVGGDWGAYQAWAKDSTGESTQSSAERFEPDRSMIDPITPKTPTLLRRWDRKLFLANGLALKAAELGCEQSGVDCMDGEPTGRLSPEAAERVQAVIPAKTMVQRLAEARTALARLAENGVTGIHDITPPEQMEVFRRLHAGGELTVRIYARPTLDKVEPLKAVGIQHGFGDEWLKIGGLKGFVDGIMGNSSARFYEPYLTSGELGSWRQMMKPEGNMLRLLLLADNSGHWPQVHAIGDHAIDHLLDLFEQVIDQNGPRDRRFRMIHTQVLRGAETAERMAKLGIIAEVQPYHAIDDMRWMAERIGERSRWAYAFKTLDDAGVLLSFGSDWPGTNASWYPAKPLLGIYAATTRQTLGGEPEGGWYPQERVDLETALRAYTVNNAWAAGEEHLKGSLSPGKLADFVVLDRDLFAIAPADIKDVRILKTVVGGRVVFDADAP